MGVCIVLHKVIRDDFSEEVVFELNQNEVRE